MRAINLSSELAKRGHRVTLISSDFFHQKKIHRGLSTHTISLDESLSLQLIPSFGYRQNVGFARLLDHASLGFNLLLFLIRNKNSRPDFCFIGYPPIEPAFILTAYCRIRKIPSLLDVKDLWPGLFYDSFSLYLKPLLKLALLPYELFARYCFSNASYLSSMTDSYLEYLSVNYKRPLGSLDQPHPLTSPQPILNDSDSQDASRFWQDYGIHDDNTIKIMFVGSLMTVFDFKPIAVAARHLNSIGLATKFIIAGTGECMSEVQDLFADIPNCILPGWIDQVQYLYLASISSAALLPYKNITNFTLNMPNKATDALALGLPIITPLRGYLNDLICKYHLGYIYDDQSPGTLVDVLSFIHKSPSELTELSNNCMNTYRKLFDHHKVYSDFCEAIEAMAVKYPPSTTIR